MKIMIESTGEYVFLDGVECHAWRGRSEAGIECVVYVRRVQVRTDDDNREFEGALREMPPSRAASTILDSDQGG